MNQKLDAAGVVEDIRMHCNVPPVEGIVQCVIRSTQLLTLFSLNR